MFSLESFHKEHETETVELSVNGRGFQMLLPKNLTRFINPNDILDGFPLWAKIWQASWVLADYIAKKPVESKKKILEIGAGIGLVSIVAASFGHRITLTEFNSDALQFARANAYLNGFPQLPIIAMDWHRPCLTETFDCIVASEVTFRKNDWQPLLRLFKTYLNPYGQVILSGEMKRVRKDIYQLLETNFNLRIQKITLRSSDEELAIFLIRMTVKE